MVFTLRKLISVFPTMWQDPSIFICYQKFRTFCLWTSISSTDFRQNPLPKNCAISINISLYITFSKLGNWTQLNKDDLNPSLEKHSFVTQDVDILKRQISMPYVTQFTNFILRKRKKRFHPNFPFFLIENAKVNFKTVLLRNGKQRIASFSLSEKMPSLFQP